MSLKINVVQKRYIVKIKCSQQKSPVTFNLEAESKEKAKLAALSYCEQEGMVDSKVISCKEDDKEKG